VSGEAPPLNKHKKLKKKNLRLLHSFFHPIMFLVTKVQNHCTTNKNFNQSHLWKDRLEKDKKSIIPTKF
jgi:hypothetical protein